MSALRRSLGIGAVALALLGAAACLVGMAGAWKVKNSVNDVADGVFDGAEEALRLVDARLARVEGVFTNGAQRSSFIAKAVERLRPEDLAAKAEATAPLLKALDEEISARLQAAQEWLDATHDVAESVGRVAQAVLSSNHAAAHPEAVGPAVARQVQEFSERIVEILTALREAKADLLAARDNVKLARTIIARVVKRLMNVEKRLADSAQAVARLRARVAETRQAVVDLDRRFPRWTTLAALAVCAVCGWFALSQAAMVRHGWALVRSKPTRVA